VKVEESGEKAVRTFIKHPEEFDLVLTDLMMPDMRGDKIVAMNTVFLTESLK
jgi:CheY-like chemotaxis protein